MQVPRRWLRLLVRIEHDKQTQMRKTYSDYDTPYTAVSTIILDKLPVPKICFQINVAAMFNSSSYEQSRFADGCFN